MNMCVTNNMFGRLIIEKKNLPKLNMYLLFTAFPNNNLQILKYIIGKENSNTYKWKNQAIKSAINLLMYIINKHL